MYTVVDYGRMAADAVRMDAYSRAIEATVRKNSIVLDLGAGTGIMSLLALRAGAKRVHAVDPNPCVQLIPEIAKENGVGASVVVHQASSLEMEVPEPIDVVISDMRGASPIVDQNLEALRDIRKRWLSPNGVIIPVRDRLRVVAVEASAMDARLEDAVALSFEQRGFKANATRTSIRNQVYSDFPAPLATSDMLSTSGVWATIEYGAGEDRVLEGSVTLEVKRGGTTRALCVFFDTELAPGISFTTEPGNSIIYNRLYLPLLESIVVKPGDQITVTIRADSRGERWAWDTSLERTGTSLKKFRQATFLGAPAALSELMRSSETSTPKLGKRGERLHRILTLMDGSRSLREIADQLQANPDDRVADALEVVRSAALRYGR